MAHNQMSYDIRAAIETNFSDSIFNDTACQAVENFINFCLHETKERTGVAYNILITCDKPALCKDFIERMQRTISFLQPNANTSSLSIDENTLLANPGIIKNAEKKYSFLIISQLNAQDSPGWQSVKKAIEETPGLTTILCATKELVQNRLIKDEHLYYRIFAHSSHLELTEPDSDDIYRLIIKRLKASYALSEAFENDMKSYIDTVYPKADLREKEFLDDLYARVIRAYFSRSVLENEIPNDCVPPYKKVLEPNAPAEETLSEVMPESDRPVLTLESKKRDTLNVLLVALSTFAGRPDSPTVYRSPNKYVYSEGGHTYEGSYYYQLEPVPKMLAKYFSDQPVTDTLDKIILLCSEASRTPKEVQLPDSTLTVSPEEFFRESVKAWMNPAIPDEEKFISVKMDENNPSAGISEVIAQIRELNAKQANRSLGKLELYIDNHGGFRGVQLSLEAIISLLRQENIPVKEIYGMNFDGSTGTILKQDAEFIMFDFVSGINEFTNYGRIDSLQRYFEMHSGQSETKDVNAKILLNTITKIAESIQTCQITEFKEGLNELSAFYKRRQSQKIDNDSYLRLFIDNIEHDYDELLKPNHSTLDEIEWCLNKGFYQQCLTLIEGRIPQDLRRHKIMNYNDKAENHAKNDKQGKNFDPNVFLLNGVINDNQLELSKPYPQVPNFLRAHQTVRSYHHELAHSKEKLSELILRNNPKPGNAFQYSVEFRAKNMLQLKYFLMLHRCFKSMRNDVNHASAKKNHVSVPLNNLRVALQTYVALGREIILNEPVDWTKYGA